MTNSPSHHHEQTTIPEFKLHHRLAIVMEESGVTVDEMADALGVHRNTVYNYNAGIRRPKRHAIKAWAVRCGNPQLWYWIENGEEPADGGGGATTIWYRGRHFPLSVVEAA